MLLYDQFISLYSSTTFSFEDLYLEKSDLEFAKRKAVSSFRCLRDPLKIHLYQHFLNHCEMLLQSSDHIPMLFVMLDMLSNSAELPIDQKEICELITQLFLQHLQHQNEAYQIAPMGHFLIDRPSALIGYLRYLLKKEVTPTQIISLNLLQDFFRYYMSTLNEENNPIHALYRLLALFPETQALGALAKHVHCSESGLSSYALDGSILLDNESTSIALNTEYQLDFTSHSTHLDNLHALFGVNFLLGAMTQYERKKDDRIFTQYLKSTCNGARTIETELPELLNTIQEKPALKQILSQLLTNDTLKQLIDRKITKTLCLIPYNTEIVSLINPHDFTVYLQDLRKRHTSEIELISDLFELFNQTKHSNMKLAIDLFEFIIDAIIDHPSVLENNQLVGKLRKFHHTRQYITQKIGELNQNLNTIIHQQQEKSIHEMDYVIIEDTWKQAMRQMIVLQSIKEIHSNFPNDQYALYIRLARLLFQKDPSQLEITLFSNLIRVTPQFDEANVTQYERLLIELVSALDNDTTRTQYIQILDEHASSNWKTKVYGHNSVFEKAVEQGNLGFIQWFEDQTIQSKQAIDTLAKKAAKAQHWNVVEHFHTHHKLTKSTINALLDMAVTQKNANAISLLWRTGKKSPDVRWAQQALKKATKAGDFHSVYALVNCPTKLSDSSLAQAFKLAVNSDYFDIARHIIENFPCKLLEYAFNHSFVHSAELNRCNRLDFLSTMTQYRITRETLSKALLKAIDSESKESEQWLNYKTQRLNASGARKRSFEESATSSRAMDQSSAHQLKKASSCETLNDSLALLGHGIFKSSPRSSLNSSMPEGSALSRAPTPF